MADETIRVHGLKEYQQALRTIDKDLGVELRKGLNEAAEIVVRAARPLVPVRTGRAAASMKPGSSQRGAAIKAGGSQAAYWSWLEWGGRVGRGKSVFRPFIPEGRTIYPSLRTRNDEILAKLDEVIGRLAERAGF
jgi:hypothetical protein